MITATHAAGLQVLPILDFDYDQPNKERYALFCEEIVKKHRLPAVELGNEPHLLHNMPPDSYAAVFSAGAEAVRKTGVPTQIYIAGEITKPIGKRIEYFKKVRAAVDERLYDVVAIHPYRNPKAPSHSPFKGRRGEQTRLAELKYYQSRVPNGKGIAVTEVGWHIQEVDEERQAQYLSEELKIWSDLNVDAVYIYQHIDAPQDKGVPPWGIFTTDWKPKLAASAIANFQQQRGVA